MQSGRQHSLERRCIDAALTGAFSARLPAGTAVFVNCESSTPHIERADCPLLARAADRFNLVFELTERSLLTDPHDLLRKVAALRSDGFAVALDDVGANLSSLALLDVIAPDVIKLDLAVVQSRCRYDQARTWATVLADHERAGAVILAEGIETEEHLQRALALGATLGQGFMFGRPRPLDACGRGVTAWTPAVRANQSLPDAGSPFDALARQVPAHRQGKAAVLALSRYLEQQVFVAPDPPMVLTSLQRTEFFSGVTRDRYHRLAALAPLVAVLGRDVAEDLGSGVRGVQFCSEDPLNREWIVLTLGANVAAALVAREVADDDRPGRDANRCFDVLLTNDRALVTEAARMLLGRMAAGTCTTD